MQLKSQVLGIVFLLFLSNFSLAQKTEKVTLSGYIKEASSGETLIGASVYVLGLQSGTTTNEYGFYSLSLPSGSYKIEFSYLGFDSQTKTIDLKESTKLDVEMGENTEQLTEVIVTSEAEDRNVTNTEMSVNKVSIATIEKMPALLWRRCSKR